MTAAGGCYPSLGRYFRTLKELAAAGCMSRQRARECLDGVKQFTEAEKKAIAANIAAGLISSQGGSIDLAYALKAWNGQFDEIYKRKEKNT